jgi:hypothetical protein
MSTYSEIARASSRGESSLLPSNVRFDLREFELDVPKQTALAPPKVPAHTRHICHSSPQVPRHQHEKGMPTALWGAGLSDDAAVHCAPSSNRPSPKRGTLHSLSNPGSSRTRGVCQRHGIHGRVEYLETRGGYSAPIH